MNSRKYADPSREGRHRWRDDGGAAAVEFAFVFPLLLVMLMGIVEFGRAWNISQVITDAAREGARRAVIADGQTKQTVVPAVIQDRLSRAGIAWDQTFDHTSSCEGWTPPAPASTTVVSVAGCGWDDESNTEARVVIRAPYPFNILSPVLSLVGGSGIAPKLMSTHFVMRNE